MNGAFKNATDSPQTLPVMKVRVGHARWRACAWSWANCNIADVRKQVMLSLFTDFKNMTEFNPNPRHEDSLKVKCSIKFWLGAVR